MFRGSTLGTIHAVCSMWFRSSTSGTIYLTDRGLDLYAVRVYGDDAEVILAVASGKLHLQDVVRVETETWDGDPTDGKTVREILVTTAGRVIFNSILPPQLRARDDVTFDQVVPSIREQAETFGRRLFGDIVVAGSHRRADRQAGEVERLARAQIDETADTAFDVLGRRILVDVDAGDHARDRALDVELAATCREVRTAIYS